MSTTAVSSTSQSLHSLNRLGFGPRPGDVEQVNTLGIDQYIQQQLAPEQISESADLTQQLSRLETLGMSPVQLAQDYNPMPGQQQRQRQTPQQRKAAQQAARQRGRIVVEQAIQARLLRAVASPRQLQEVMVDFWFNHFNVFVGKGLTRLWVGNYEAQAIRPHALGRFRELLGATARHPAMLFYLDNWQNTAPNSSGARGRFSGLNENYARELMELHTLGVNGGYTQQDVITLAKIFTGWGLPKLRGRQQRQPVDSSGFYFDADRHDFSDKTFLGQRIPGSGMAEGEQALDILARHPATATFISHQLVQHFVADQPPAALVTRVAQQFQATDGNIPAVLATLFQSTEFRNSAGAKFKSPYHYVISSLRATATMPDNYRLIFGMLRQLGMPLYGCPTPDGYKTTQAAWLNPDAMLRRLSFATALGSGRFQREQPIDPTQLFTTLGNGFSEQTRSVITSSPPQLQAALILGSPEFMHY